MPRPRRIRESGLTRCFAALSMILSAFRKWDLLRVTRSRSRGRRGLTEILLVKRPKVPRYMYHQSTLVPVVARRRNGARAVPLVAVRLLRPLVESMPPPLRILAVHILALRSEVSLASTTEKKISRSKNHQRGAPMTPASLGDHTLSRGIRSVIPSLKT